MIMVRGAFLLCTRRSWERLWHAVLRDRGTWVPLERLSSEEPSEALRWPPSGASAADAGPEIPHWPVDVTGGLCPGRLPG